MSNWHNNFDLSHPNWTARTPNKSKYWSDYDGVGAWQKDSSTPPWGWPIAIVLGIALFALILFGPTLVMRLAGV